jgi:hypothetical protein
MNVSLAQQVGRLPLQVKKLRPAATPKQLHLRCFLAHIVPLVYQVRQTPFPVVVLQLSGSGFPTFRSSFRNLAAMDQRHG